MKSHRSRGVAAAAALVLTLTLGACGQADPGAAAHVGGQTIPESDVQTAVTELSQIGLPQPPMPAEVANTMVIGRLLEPNLAQEGVHLSDDDGRRLIEDSQTQLSQPTLDALRAIAGINLYNSVVQGQPVPGFDANPEGIIAAGERTQQQLAEGDENGDITLSPRYRPEGVADNWLVQQESPMGQLPPGHP